MGGKPPFSFARFRSGLLGNLGAQSSALFVQLIVALITVPVFAWAWGIEAYGVWLILYSLPAYLVLADLGYPAAAAIEMASLVAKGDRQQASQLFRQTTGMAITGAVLILLLVASALHLWGNHWLSFLPKAVELGGELTVTLLAAFAMAGIVTRALFAALRATGHFATGIYIIALTALINVLLAGGMALAGFGLPGAAAGYLLGEVAGTCIMGLAVRRLAPDMQPAFLPKGVSMLFSLSAPALGLVFVLIGHALVLQGSVMVLGLVAGAAAVPAFVAARTLARLGIQAVGVVNLAINPELTFARSRNDTERSADLVATNLIIAVLLLIPGAILFALLGREIIQIWSGGIIEASASLIIVMALVMLVGGLWGPLAGFLTAENRQATFAYAFTVFAALGVLIASVLSNAYAATGTTAAMLLIDLAMLAWTYRKARHAGFFDEQSLLHSPLRTLDFLRSRLGRRNGDRAEQ